MSQVVQRQETGFMFRPNESGMRKVSGFWYEAKDGDPQAREIFNRHYSRKNYRDGRCPSLFVGPGEKVVLITANGDALFVWRKFKCGDGNKGVNCAVFRNESDMRSSDLILDAESVAHARWPGERLFTFVNARRVKSPNPGCCFKKAGWRQCGITKWNKLLIFEKL